MTTREARAGLDRLMRSVFTLQWEQAREAGLSEEQIAALWEKRRLQPPADWQPPAVNDEPA
jgi:hypothetical protein